MKQIRTKIIVAAAFVLCFSPVWAGSTNLIVTNSSAPDARVNKLDALAAKLKAQSAQLPSLYPPMSTLSKEMLQRAHVHSLGAVKQSTFSSLAVAPPVTGCYDIALGSAYNAPTAITGQTDCFEFIAPDATKIVAYVVNLPAAEQHDVHLVQVNEDGSLIYLDNQAGTSPNKIVEAIPGGPVRVLLLVDSQQGNGGATFQFQVTGTTGYDKFEPNDSALHPAQLSGNQQIDANLDTVSDFDYYAVQIPASQTSNSITFTGNGTQTAELETAPDSWATLSSGTTYVVTSSAGAALMLRVYDTGTTAPSAQAYSLRISDGAGTAGFYQFLDTENISHLVPNLENVSRTVTAGVAAWDHTGNVRLPPGEHITVQAYDQDAAGNLSLLTTASGYTDASGNLLVTLNTELCKGSGTITKDFQTTSSPADHYRITYNPGSFAVAYLDGGVLNTRSSYSTFAHICSESYLGNY